MRDRPRARCGKRAGLRSAARPFPDERCIPEVGPVPCPFFFLPDVLKRDRKMTEMASLITFSCQRKRALKEQ